MVDGVWKEEGGGLGVEGGGGGGWYAFCSCDARCQGLTTLDHAGISIATCQDLNQLTRLGLRAY